MSTNPLAQLAAKGVSIWLDDLSRSRIASGSLRDLITNRSVSGVTTNPTIFAGALAKGEGYQSQVAELAASGADATAAIFAITTKDVADACDIFAGAAPRWSSAAAATRRALSRWLRGCCVFRWC